MITQEFLSQCSDEQINKGVAWLECKKSDINNGLFGSWVMINDQPTWHGRYFKPSSYPNDIMPIAFANEISIEKEEGEEEWCAMSGVRYADGYYYPVQAYDMFSTNTNPLRAICEVYILMSVNK